eukprot:scpid10701/ scgid32170/ Spermatogenesis-associated protein 4
MDSTAVPASGEQKSSAIDIDDTMESHAENAATEGIATATESTHGMQATKDAPRRTDHMPIPIEGLSSTLTLDSKTDAPHATGTAAPPKGTQKKPVAKDTSVDAKQAASAYMAVTEMIPREIYEWLCEVVLTRPVRVPKHDLRNGFLVADLLMNYFPHKRSQLIMVDGLSLEVMKSNWKILRKFFQQHPSLAVDDILMEGVMHMKPNAAVRLLCILYQWLTHNTISDRTVQETLKAPPMAGWTDAVYQSRLPLFARTTASQTLKTNLCTTEQLGHEDINKSKDKAQFIITEYEKRRQEVKHRDPSRFTTKPKIDKYPPAKRGMTPPKPRIHDRKQLGNTQETDDIDVKFGEMSLPTSQPGSRSQAGSMTKGYKPPTVVFKLTDRYPERGYYHPAGRLGNGTTETGRDAHAQVLVTKAVDQDVPTLSPAGAHPGAEQLCIDPHRTTTTQPPGNDTAHVHRPSSPPHLPVHRITDKIATLHDTDYSYALLVEAAGRQGLESGSSQPVPVRLHRYDRDDPPQHVLDTLHPDCSRIIGHSENVRRGDEYRGFRPTMHHFPLFKPTCSVPTDRDIPKPAADADNKHADRTQSDPSADARSAPLSPADNIVRILAEMDDATLEQLNAFESCSEDDASGGDDDSDEEEDDGDVRSLASLLHVRACARAASGEANDPDLLDILTRAGDKDVLLSEEDYLHYQSFGKQTLYGKDKKQQPQLATGALTKSFVVGGGNDDGMAVGKKRKTSDKAHAGGDAKVSHHSIGGKRKPSDAHRTSQQSVASPVPGIKREASQIFGQDQQQPQAETAGQRQLSPVPVPRATGVGTSQQPDAGGRLLAGQAEAKRSTVPIVSVSEEVTTSTERAAAAPRRPSITMAAAPVAQYAGRTPGPGAALLLRRQWSDDSDDDDESSMSATMTSQQAQSADTTSSADLNDGTDVASMPGDGFYVVQPKSTLHADPARLSLEEVLRFRFHTHNRQFPQWRLGKLPAGCKLPDMEPCSPAGVPEDLIAALGVEKPAVAQPNDAEQKAELKSEIGVATRRSRLETLLRVHEHYLRVYEAQSGRLNATHTHAIGDLSQFSADEIKLNRDRLLATLEDLERAEHMKKNSKRTDIEIPDEDTWTPDTYIESPMYTSTPMAGLPDELSYLSSSEDDDDHRTDIIYSYPGVGDAANVQHARRTLNEHERIYMALLQKDGSTLVQDTFLPADMSKAADIGSITGDVVAIKTAPPPAVDRNQKSAETSDDSYSQGRHPAWPESSDSVDEDAYLEQVLDFLEQVEHMTDQISRPRPDFPPDGYFAAGYRHEEQRRARQSQSAF